MTLSQSPSADGVPRLEDQAGTPLSLQDPLTLAALETVEFREVLDVVAARAAGPLGADRVRARRPVADAEWATTELTRVEQVAALFRRRDGLAAEPVDELGPTLARLRIEGSELDGAELAAIRRLITSARRVRADLDRVEAQASLSHALAADVPARAVERRLEQSVDDDGNLLDTASPALAAARRDVQLARGRLVKKLESTLRAIDPSGAAEAGVTVRDGRYVIPVRRDLRSRPDGIIHGESASAGTLFIEPSSAIELGNALREAQSAEEREVRAVLRELTALLRPLRELLVASFEMCIAVDDLVARARWAAELDGYAPRMTPAPGALRIVRGRHPLLLGQGIAVVAFDLVLDAGERTLLVSGPNTGGKTVLLKAVALMAALAQSGIVPPLAESSELPVFRRFAADIGDRQSIAASLSTFSAHARVLGAILTEADAGTLILLDEVGSGTDPAEGAALAAASLVELTRRGALTLATTHLGQLKTLAQDEPGVVNASLAFDAATLTPTYHFQKGVPGRSYGLAIATRLGLPAAVLANAEARVPDAERSFDALLAAVEKRQRDVERREGEVGEREVLSTEQESRLTAREAQATAREAELNRRERDADRRARKEARDFLLASRRTLEEALAAAQGAVDEAHAREARRLLEDEIRRQGALLEEDVTPPAVTATPAKGPIEPGDHVMMPGGIRGSVLELRPEGMAVIMAGSMRLVVPQGDLTRTVAPRSEPTKSPDLPAVAAPLEIDLRGMTGDEAEAATLSALDAAVLAEHAALRIIHGMGTGVVRDRVRRLVQRDRRVRRSAFAPRQEGGTGVTIVEFGD
jgi:DNA mismatch repair protein MutS2